jgi:hypothetical protein
MTPPLFFQLGIHEGGRGKRRRLTLRPTERTLLITVFGKQEPMWATTQSKWGACFTLVSNRAAIQLSVSVSAHVASIH